MTPNRVFDKARELYRGSAIPFKTDGHYDFIYYTTRSFEEMRQGKEVPIIAEETRIKAEHISGFKKRYDTKTISNSFLMESIWGLADTNI